MKKLVVLSWIKELIVLFCIKLKKETYSTFFVLNWIKKLVVLSWIKKLIVHFFVLNWIKTLVVLSLIKNRPYFILIFFAGERGLCPYNNRIQSWKDLILIS